MNIPQPPFCYLDSVRKIDARKRTIEGIVVYPSDTERFSLLDNVPYFLILESAAQLSGILVRQMNKDQESAGGYLVSIDKCTSAVRISIPATIHLQSKVVKMAFPFCTLSARAAVSKREIFRAVFTVRTGSC